MIRSQGNMQGFIPFSSQAGGKDEWIQQGMLNERLFKMWSKSSRVPTTLKH
jgi:hypothetical protein